MEGVRYVVSETYIPGGGNGLIAVVVTLLLSFISSSSLHLTIKQIDHCIFCNSNIRCRAEEYNNSCIKTSW